jgi:hypothetical protein
MTHELSLDGFPRKILLARDYMHYSGGGHQIEMLKKTSDHWKSYIISRTDKNMVGYFQN